MSSSHGPAADRNGPAAMDALANACEVRPGEAADEVQGVRPSYVAAPGTLAEASEVMRAASAGGLAVVPRGAGTKLHWAAPPERCDLLIDMRGLGRVIEHAAGDLVVKVEAGLCLGELQSVLAGAGQQLALDTLLPGATVGGTLATATGGPRRLLYGSARDLLIGITVIRADGLVAHAGGRVVKNVAGYDLGKLFTGSFGTLGLIAEAAFRLHPLPQAGAYVSARAGDGQDAHAMVQALLHSSLVPTAIEADGPDPITVTVLIEGVADGVPDRSDAARELIGGEVGPAPDWWGRLPKGDVLVDVRATPTALPALVNALNGTRGRIRGSAGRGHWHVALARDTAPDTLARLRRHGTATVLSTATPEHDLDRWGPVPALPLMRRVKDQFDPEHRLSPGRFVGGI